jgi:hypothetical protein
MPKFKMAVPHTLSQQDAVDRIKSYSEKMHDKFAESVKNLQESWEENCCKFGFRTFGMDFSGSLTVLDSEVQIESDLPFRAMMFKGRIEKEAEKEFGKMLA